MKEIALNKSKNGMTMLLVSIAGTILGTIGFGVGMDRGGVLGTVTGLICMVLMAASIISLVGLKVLKPQEALVLTLFGKYIGTLKGEGFYWVNPFCSAVNPAAGTQLNQSGDVKASKNWEAEGKKMSLKIMTLSNNRQKINDCLGNPVEIGIAVTWRIVDTAKAVFDVDNYKEFLSLQCDTALRNIVRIYPYDVAPGVDTTGDGMADDLLAPLWSRKKTTVINDIDKLLFARDSWQGKKYAKPMSI